MNTTWKRFNIFISSTFKDMDFERDIIKFRVIPALNIKYRPRHVALQAIDLRLGVNTAKMSEEESARKVLTVCADNIDSARPFFIGLIGGNHLVHIDLARRAIDGHACIPLQIQDALIAFCQRFFQAFNKIQFINLAFMG